MKKITPVFGPQELFDGADDDIEFAVEYCESERASNGCRSVHFIKEIKRALEFVQSVHVTAIAHRRVEDAQEPKRWTVEEKKAGRLPASGCKAIYIPESFAMCSCDVIHVDGNKACIKCENNHSMHSDWFGVVDVTTLIPIETPEEKAQREEDEFVNSVMQEEYDPNMSEEAKECTLHAIRVTYRRLKCEQSAPAQAKDGA